MTAIEHGIISHSLLLSLSLLSVVVMATHHCRWTLKSETLACKKEINRHESNPGPELYLRLFFFISINNITKAVNVRVLMFEMDNIDCMFNALIDTRQALPSC